MDVHFLYQDQAFVWDSEKAATNVRKHDVHFEHACEVFFDRFICVEDASVNEEARDAAIGMTDDMTLLLVVHIFREDDVIRIISARQATRKERVTYENTK